MKIGQLCGIWLVLSLAVDARADNEKQPALLSASSPDTPAVIDAEIERVWQSHDFQLSDDVVIVVPEPAALPSPKPTVQTRTRQPKVQAARIIAPPTKPVLTRRQQIEREIAQEQRALTQLRSQLSQARAQTNSTKIQQITSQILDREGNIAALQRELRR